MLCAKYRKCLGMVVFGVPQEHGRYVCLVHAVLLHVCCKVCFVFFDLFGVFFHLMTWQVNAHHGGDRATSAASRSVVVTDAEGGGRLNPCQAGGGRLNPLELRSHTVDANTP